MGTGILCAGALFPPLGFLVTENQRIAMQERLKNKFHWRVDSNLPSLKLARKPVKELALSSLEKMMKSLFLVPVTTILLVSSQIFFKTGAAALLPS